MNISEPVEKSVLSAKAKDILLNKGIVTIGELFSAKGKQFSEIINENSDIAKELEGFIRRNAEQAERAGISIDYDCGFCKRKVCAYVRQRKRHRNRKAWAFSRYI